MELARKYIYYTVGGIVLLVLSITALSYAFLTDEFIQENSNILTTLDCMSVSIESKSESLNLKNSYPLLDKESIKLKPYTFEVTNNCNSYVEYAIALSVINTSSLTNEDYVKVSLNGNKNLKPSTFGELKQENELSILENSFKNYILISDSFSGNQSHTYDFRMWLNGDNNDIWTDQNIKNKNLIVRLSIIGVSKDTPDMLINDFEVDEDSYFFNGPIKRNEIEEIIFTNQITEETSSWDVSNKQNNMIKAHHVLNEQTGLYQVYIGQEEEVLANIFSSNLFSNIPNLKKLDIVNLNTKYVEDMSYMFYKIKTSNEELQIIGIENFDTSNVRDMSYMFSDMKVSNLNLNLSTWNTSNLKYTTGMFDGYEDESSTINLSLWDTNYIEDITYMFANSKIKNIRLDEWNYLTTTNNNMFTNSNIEAIFVKNEAVKSWLNPEGNPFKFID